MDLWNSSWSEVVELRDADFKIDWELCPWTSSVCDASQAPVPEYIVDVHGRTQGVDSQHPEDVEICESVSLADDNIGVQDQTVELPHKVGVLAEGLQFHFDT
jgi:hypothetical protein